MREKLVAIVLVAVFSSIASANENNDVIANCLKNTSNYNKAAKCYHDWLSKKDADELAELRDFLQHNPRYRVPGQSLNRCWGQPREMPFKDAYIERVGKDGFRAGVSYKDKLPAGCYENAPWDNRKK